MTAAAKERLERFASSTSAGYVVAVMDAYGSEPAGQLYDDLRTALDRIERLEASLLYIAESDHHYRKPPKPKSDGGVRGWAGHHAVWALTGLNGSFVNDDKVRAALATPSVDTLNTLVQG